MLGNHLNPIFANNYIKHNMLFKALLIGALVFYFFRLVSNSPKIKQGPAEPKIKKKGNRDDYIDYEEVD